ncbi:VOC family protein [Cognatishimia sp. F0-27]|uniref:VOC family protein n=1 Tax=Cognatishimia sp. F0-27 TaxID=2816855 RepID=UPI001D0C354D|nr:VOC family protein [Cognatishimia sp. F0-27]MCC1494452.1 VOC family protein [Cognatishimia sp. F0-27]
MEKTHGKVWWSELMTRDVDAAIAYYKDTCGWTVDAMPMGDGTTYWVCSNDGAPTAGIMDMAGLPGTKDMPPHWFTYLAVDDVEAATEATVAAGGQVIRPPFEVPNTGLIALVTDPTGAAVGLMTPAPHTN